MRADRWEIGSFYHWAGTSSPGTSQKVPWSGGRVLSSGRDALRMALAVGAADFGWRRLWVPDFFCQQVVAALVETVYEVRPYPDNPLRPTPDLPDVAPADAVLVMNYFGMRTRISHPLPERVGLIEDHSHDPTSVWAKTSAADFCVSSMRKTTPVPAGGVLWSPRGHPLPRQPRLLAQRQRNSAAMLQAMVLKSMYLDGGDVQKGEFRALADQAENGLHVPAISAADPISRGAISAFPFEEWRIARSENHAALRGMLGDLGWGRVLRTSASGTAPFSAALVVDSPERRDAVRARLVDARIYPAALWSLESPVLSPSDDSVDLSRRILSIPCDARYDANDMARIAEVLLGTA